MIIRCIEPKDLFDIRRIHNEHFKHEFELPDFKEFHCVYVVEEGGKIITVGGIRPIAESIIVTDMNIIAKTRVRALLEMLNAHKYCARTAGYDGIHCFVQNEVWEKQLSKVGFHHTKGEALVLGI